MSSTSLKSGSEEGSGKRPEMDLARDLSNTYRGTGRMPHTPRSVQRRLSRVTVRTRKTLCGA